MERYTSEQALNGILNLLENVIGQANKNDKKDETSSMVEQLVQGTVAANSAGVDFGQQIEQIATGFDIIKKSKINNADIEMIAGSVSRLATALNSFSVNDEVRSDSVVKAVSLLNMIGSIDRSTVRNIKNLVSIGVDEMKQFSDVIRELNALQLDDSNVNSINVMINELNALGSIDRKVITAIKQLNGIDKDAFANLSEALSSFSSIDQGTIDSIRRLKDLDVESMQQLGKLIKSLSFMNEDVLDSINNMTNIKPDAFSALDSLLTDFLMIPVDKKTLANASNVVKIIKALTEINYNQVDSINEFGHLEPESAEKLNSLVRIIDTGKVTKAIVNKAVMLTDVISALGSVNEQAIENINMLSMIDSDSLKNVVEIIPMLDFKKMTKTQVANIKTVVDVLTAFGGITEQTVDNINELADIDPAAFNNLITALSELDFSKIKHIGGKDAKKNLDSLSSFITTLN